MSKKLIIAEKPSVAADIARALGGFSRKGDYFEAEDYLLSSAVGHLLELVPPEEHDVKKGKWSFARLPVIPPHFDLAPIERSAERLSLLLKLIKRKDVTQLVNACDAGREGELIFRFIVQHARVKKPIERLWLQSMTPTAIRDGFAGLRPDRELLPLADAAKSRAEADWLIGINGTRAMTAFNSRQGGFYLTTVGRVQTPTLTILLDREARIRAFELRSYWEVHARFSIRAGDYEGRWFDPAFRKGEDAELRPERLWTRAVADAVVAACKAGTGKVSEETKQAYQSPPLLFDLTSLQREANGRFGFSAKSTLGLAQALYEKHKVLTYPRTDARALPEDYVGVVKKTLEMLALGGIYAPHAKAVQAGAWVKKDNRRIFDNSKVSDHFAIIPTQLAPRQLSDAEAKLYDLVVRRFLAALHPAAEFAQTVRLTQVGEHQFRTEGRVLVKAGWLSVYGRTVETASDSLPPLKAGESAGIEGVEARALQTKPPARYTEATLLSAMEGAGKLVEDDELRAAMGAKGLGTPATRAAVIEGLIKEEYVHRNGRELVPTPKAFSLLFALRHFGVDEITSPELTGDWEFKLKQMEAGKLPREEFMSHIESVTRDMVGRIRDGEIPDTAFATVSAPCARCGAVIQENYHKFQCQGCDFSLWKVLSGREWSPEEVAELVTRRYIGPLSGFRSRIGRPFAAGIRLNDELRVEFDFGQAGGDQDGPPPDFSTQTSLGACPKCGAGVFEHGVAYACEKSVGPTPSCDFRSGRIILQQAVEREQMGKLLASGKTDLLTHFVSRKGRPFKAFLVKTPEGRVGFEFQVRAPKAGGAAKPGKGAKAAAAPSAVQPPARRAKPAAAQRKAASAGRKKRAS